MRSMKGRLVVWSVLVFGVLFGAFAFVVYRTVHDAELAHLDARLLIMAAALRSELHEDAQDGEPADTLELQEIAASFSREVHTLLRPRSGPTIVNDTLIDNNASLFDELDVSANEYDARVADGFRLLRMEIVEGDEAYTIEMMAAMTEIDARLSRLRTLFWVALPLALVLIGVLSYLIARGALAPLTRMTATARSISPNNLTARISEPGTNDEVQHLSQSFNRMLDRLERAFKAHRKFVADASHEFRTPLTIITEELEYARRYVEPGKVDDSIEAALIESEFMARLTDNLLLLAKLDSDYPAREPELVRLDELLVDCVGSVTRYVRHHEREIEVALSEEIGVRGDPDQLRQVILNLLDNAVKHGGADARVSARAFREGDRAVVEVSDSGPGIADDDRERIFDRFYRGAAARASSPGTGLGLAIVSQLVARHGGDIEVGSGGYGGARFTVFLPLAVNTESDQRSG